MLLRALLRTAPTQSIEHEQQTFHHILVVAVILLKIESKTEGTQADTKIRTQVQTTYPKGYPASLTSDVTRWFGILVTCFFAAFLSAAAKTDAQWYSVKSLSEGAPSLAELLGVSNSNLDQLLSLSCFGWIRKGGGLVVLADNFKNFLVMSDTEA
jgi:hypothetical protein